MKKSFVAFVVIAISILFGTNVRADFARQPVVCKDDFNTFKVSGSQVPTVVAIQGAFVTQMGYDGRNNGLETYNAPGPGGTILRIGIDVNDLSQIYYLPTLSPITCKNVTGLRCSDLGRDACTAQPGCVWFEGFPGGCTGTPR